jgi:hypothetical protein
MATARLGTSIALAVLVSGCFGPAILNPPQGQLSGLGEVFGGANPAAAADEAPPGSKKSGTFAASYQDVFRAVVVGASQNQINVESENRSGGYVMGTRAVQIVPPVPRCPNSQSVNGRALPLRYYYVIAVKEKGPKTTEVVAAIKAQGVCWTGMCYESVQLPCKAYAVPHWTTAQENPDESLTQLMIFIRNNLIAAGAL